MEGEAADKDMEVNKNGVEPTTSPAMHDVPFSAGAAPFHQAAIWLLEVGVGSGITSDRYPMEEMMELIMIARDLGSAMTLGFIGKAREGAEKLVNEMQLPKVSKELHEMCKTSMECNIQEMRRMVKENKTQFGGSEKIEVFPIATYPKYVITMNENREVYRGDVERNGLTDRPYFTKIQKLGVRPVTDWMEEGMTNLNEGVELLMEGKSGDAKKRMIEFINRFGAMGGNNGLLQAKYKVIEKQLTADTYWKKYMEENRAMVRKYLHGELSKLREPNVKARYSELHTGMADATKLGQARERLVTELRDLGSKADQTLSRISDAVKQSQTALEQSGGFHDLDSDVMVAQFKHFSADYVEDLQGLRGAIQEALRDGDVPAMAKVYDTAASRFDDYKIAGRLIEKVLENIRQQVRKS